MLEFKNPLPLITKEINSNMTESQTIAYVDSLDVFEKQRAYGSFYVDQLANQIYHNDMKPLSEFKEIDSFERFVSNHGAGGIYHYFYHNKCDYNTQVRKSALVAFNYSINRSLKK